MMFIKIQLFAHHKGQGSTKNGRDSNSKRLGVKRADGQQVRHAQSHPLPGGGQQDRPGYRCIRALQRCVLLQDRRPAAVLHQRVRQRGARIHP